MGKVVPFIPCYISPQDLGPFHLKNYDIVLKEIVWLQKRIERALEYEKPSSILKLRSEVSALAAKHATHFTGKVMEVLKEINTTLHSKASSWSKSPQNVA